jgi:cell fate regulator YaaT (PSP1 superfamily)
MTLASDVTVVRIKVCCTGRPSVFSVPGSISASSLRTGVPLVVETETGVGIGHVTGTVFGDQPGMAGPSQRVLRVATDEDLAIRRRHLQREREAYRVGLLKIRERGLAMKLARVEQLYDGSRLIFYFTAEGRIDFRELVRELATEFRSRIEMRQIGVRDEARMVDGYGSCGRQLCCASWLQSFEPVSIKMAKQQDLSLNPSKLSGLCGRLKCCLRYELPEGKLPKRGDVRDEAVTE